MRQVWHDFATHRLATALVLLAWLAIWGPATIRRLE